MKKIFTLTLLGGALSMAPLAAQTIYEGAALTGKDLNGTARFVGMGGAMGALGGDISTIATNPAGIGLYRSSDVMASFGFSIFSSESNYLGKQWSQDKTRFSFDNMGFVFSSKIGNNTPLRFVNFGFNYHKAKSFYKNTEMSGGLGDYSQTYLMASQAYDIVSWGASPYTDDGLGWLSVLGYESGLIYQKQPNHPGYYGMSKNGLAAFRSEERGGIDQYDFNVALNFNDRFYLGLTLGAYTVNYDKYTFYGEEYPNQVERYNLQSWNRVEGSGFDLKLGTIIRPFEHSPFRIGLAVHTPTFYNLDYKTSARIASTVIDPATNKSVQRIISTWEELPNRGDMVRAFNFRTPWTYNLSMGYTVGKSLALGVEYEYKDFSSMKFKDADGYASSFSYENSTTNMMKGVNTLRLGMEYKVIPEFAFRLGYQHSTAAFNADAMKDVALNSIQTDTDFSNSRSANHYTLGIGYRGSMFYADLAYKFSVQRANLYPFINGWEEDGMTYYGSPEATGVKESRGQTLFTVGMRF